MKHSLITWFLAPAILLVVLPFSAFARTPDSDLTPAKPTESQCRTYRAIGGRSIIAIVSSDELELRQGGDNIVCKYTEKDGKLRVIVNMLGTTTAKYFNLTPQGLVDEDGEVFYEPEAFQNITAQIQLNTKLLEAVERDDAAGIDALVAKGASVESRDNRKTALMIAINGGLTNAVSALLKNGANPNQKTDSDKKTPLMSAAGWQGMWGGTPRKSEHDKIVSMLCEAKVDLNAVDKEGNTALILSLMSNNHEAARILITTGADRGIRNNVGRAAFSYLKDVAVWVDQSWITRDEVQKETIRLFSRVSQDIPADQIPAIKAKLLQQAVDNLVVRQLVKADMEGSGVQITQEEIEKGKLDIEKSMPQATTLAMVIATANMSMEELENNLRLDLFKSKVLKGKLQLALEAVTDEAIRAYYNEHLDEFTQPGGRLASHILIRVPAGVSEANKAELRRKAEGFRNALLGGADFAKLASEVSGCPSRTRGGALGVIPKGREAKSFEDAVYGQRIGEIGEVVETPIGYHVIKVTGEQEKKVAHFNEVKDRLKAVLISRAQQKITTEYIDGLKIKATIRLEEMLAAAKTVTNSAEATVSMALEPTSVMTNPATAP